MGFIKVFWSLIFSSHSCLAILELYYVKTLLSGLPSGNRKLMTTGALIWLGVAYPHFTSCSVTIQNILVFYSLAGLFIAILCLPI